MAKFKWHWGWGIAITCIFVILLGVRLGYFREPPPPQVADIKPSIHRPAESWMAIYQNRQKIGFSQRQFSPLEDGGYMTTDSVTLQVNTLGITQALHLMTETHLKSDFSFSSFKFELTSSLFRFTARGYADEDKLVVFSGLPHAQTRSEFPLKDLPHISTNIYEAAFLGALAKGNTRNFNIFDPSTLALRTIAVTREVDEIIPILGKRVLTQKYCSDFMGAKSCAWLDKTGEVLKETGLLGMTMEKVSPEAAQAGLAAAKSADFAQIASIPSNIPISNPSKATRIEVFLQGASQLDMISDSRQQFQDGLLIIAKEPLPSPEDEAKPIPVMFRAYLNPTALVQSAHPRMVKEAKRMIQPGDRPQQRLRKIVDWVNKNIEKKPVLSVPNALEVLEHKTGDCNEHAVLTAALLRAAGIPAQIEAGLVYLNGRFYYHAWNRAYVGAWITADAVFNQIPADVTHIRLVTGEGGEQLDILGVMGNITLEVRFVGYD